jgi:hypothetical protein
MITGKYGFLSSSEQENPKIYDLHFASDEVVDVIKHYGLIYHPNGDGARRPVGSSGK